MQNLNRIASYTALAGLLLTGCTNGQDTQLNQVFPSAAVTPEVLAFGDQPVDYSTQSFVTVINSGQVALNIGDLEIDDPFSVIGEFEPVVPPDGEVNIALAFSPTNFESYAGALSIPTDDPEHPSLTVVLTGNGVHAPTPDIEVDPLAMDFGVAPAGVPMTRYFTIANPGDATLNVSSLDQSGSGAFTVVGDVTGFQLPPGQSTLIVVNYLPVSSNGDNGALVIHSDDPDEADVTVTLIGNGGGDFEYPQPVVVCPEDVAPRDTVVLDGTGSYDPGGHEPLTYAWTLLEVPDRSQALLTNTTNDTAYLATDIAGDYSVQLAVTNTIGVSSAPTTCTFTAIPEENLHVELTWSTAAADLDMHLLDGGAQFFVSPGDCNWCNQSPNWGASGSTDNPSLDLDDRQGYGPENINVDAPANDTYSIKVHYFTDNGDTTTTATVKVYLYGALAGEASAAMTRDTVWDAGQIKWPDAVYVTQSTPNYTAPSRLCE